MRSLAKKAARLLGFLWGLVPFILRRGILRALLLIESQVGKPSAALGHLFQIADDLDRLLAERATAYGKGVNPKHHLTRYHDFFVERIAPGSRVLDIGCGIGAVSRSIVERVPEVEVVGIDFDPRAIARARVYCKHDRLTFLQGDAVASLPPGPWDAVVLSNVLEHIEDRIGFLRKVAAQAQPGKMLIRVPLFERHWHMPLRKELGVDFRSDPTHFIEHTLEEFEAELSAAGLRITERVTQWGEIWAVAEAQS